MVKHGKRKPFTKTQADEPSSAALVAQDTSAKTNMAILPQPKIIKNTKKPLYRRTMRRKRHYIKKSTSMAVSDPNDPKSWSRGYLFTDQVRTWVLSLINHLRAIEVIRLPVAAHGRGCIRAIPAALHLDHCTSTDPETEMTVSRVAYLYGASADDVLIFGGRLASAIAIHRGKVAVTADTYAKVHLTSAMADTTVTATVAETANYLLRSAGPLPPQISLADSPTAVSCSPSFLVPCPLPQLFKEPGQGQQLSELPEPSLHADWLVGGKHHCGGDLLFPFMTLVHAQFDGRMPLFMMKPGAAAFFSGSESAHGTSAHHQESDRSCKAHLSFAVQTPAKTYGFSRNEPAARRLHDELMAAGELDATDPHGPWADAVWLGVFVTRGKQEPSCKLEYNLKTMMALPYSKIVLYDIETNKPLVLYDSNGGLGASTANAVRQRYGFMHDYKFTLNRMAESAATGALGLDAQGYQRMLMLGIRHQGRNVKSRPNTGGQRQLEVANKQGDLDGYVVHWDDPDFAPGKELITLFNAISKRMRAALPTACQVALKALEAAKVRERLYCKAANGVMSDDMLTNNVGMSAAYQSPAHVDKNDMGWTAAMAVKCSKYGM